MTEYHDEAPLRDKTIPEMGKDKPWAVRLAATFWLCLLAYGAYKLGVAWLG